MKMISIRLPKMRIELALKEKQKITGDMTSLLGSATIWRMPCTSRHLLQGGRSFHITFRCNNCLSLIAKGLRRDVLLVVIA